MRILIAVVVLACFLQAGISNKHRNRRNKAHTTVVRNILSDDALLTVEPIPPDIVRGQCSCECCENESPSRKFRCSRSKLVFFF